MMPGGRRYGFSIGNGYPGEKLAENGRRVWSENEEKHEILHECGREKSPGRGDYRVLHHFSRQIFLDRSQDPEPS